MWASFLSVGCGARAHSGPCPYWLIWLAVLCQGPQSGPAGAWPWHQIACQISRPQAAFPCAPAARNAGKGPACGALAGGVEIAAPQGRRGAAWTRPQLGPQASAPPADSPGLAAAGGEGLAAATPGGEGGGRAGPARPAPQAWPGGTAGRSAADRAGGADGPTAPTQWGPGRPGAPAPQPARGRSKARPAASGPAGGLALLCGGVPPCNGWRPT